MHRDSADVAANQFALTGMHLEGKFTHAKKAVWYLRRGSRQRRK
jgi:hypothetical protein